MYGGVPVQQVPEVGHTALHVFVGRVGGGVKFPVPLQAVVVDEEGVGVELEAFVVSFVSGIAGDAAEAGGAQDIFSVDDIQSFYFFFSIQN